MVTARGQKFVNTSELDLKGYGVLESRDNLGPDIITSSSRLEDFSYIVSKNIPKRTSCFEFRFDRKLSVQRQDRRSFLATSMYRCHHS